MTVPTPEARKIVSVLFCDIAGSVELGERLDSEALRRLMSQYFQQMQAVLERHGGVAEKFIGDAVMGVFGIPRLHEDDALRAVRAAVEMREAVEGLNEEFEQAYGTRLVTRTGVNTGEVVAGDATAGQSFIAGDAVNVAARLEQSAGRGEILIGETTFRLVRDAVTAEAVEPLTVKGKSEPVSAWRLIDVTPGAPGWARRLDSPIVGRDQELRVLEDAFQRAVETRRANLVTVMGPAGVGKSRLANELLTRIGSRANVLQGRCLPYGEGITFWPIAEVLKDAAGISDLDTAEEARPKMVKLLEGAPDGPLIEERLTALLGISPVAPGIQETFWSVRKLIEQLALDHPLVVVFDDIHWGEPTFLDLLEYLVDLVGTVPVMVLCLARPELLETRPGWMSGKANASQLVLHPLSNSETAGLIENLLTGARMTENASAQIAAVAEGNPLFVEETLRMMVDDGMLRRENGGWALTGDLSGLSIPPTIHALLTARLERLDGEERAVIERASVIGRVFWWGAVSELTPEDERSRVGAYLQSLNRKELVRPDYSDFREEDAFRFAHMLIRDAAYGAIPKATRAELHARFADWIQRKARDRAGEYEELVGYHLEQGHRYLTELGRTGPTVEELGRRAATPLASAGRRAFARGDMTGAVNLLSRASALLSEGNPARVELLPDLAFALLETGDFARLQEVVAEAKQAGEASGDANLKARGQILDLWMRVFTDPEGWAEEAHREALGALATFEERHDEPGLARGWSLLGLVQLLTCQFAASEEAWEKAAAHAHEAGNDREELEYLSWLPLVIWGGPTPAEEAIHRCQEVFERAQGDRKAMATALIVQAKFEAMRGRFDQARELVDRGRAIGQEVAMPVWMAGPLTQFCGWVELLAGDPKAAEELLRPGVAALREIGELSWLSTVAAILAEALHQQGRHEEVDEFIQMSREAAGSEDVYSQSMLRSVWAKEMVRQGEADSARQLAREAVEFSRPTDFRFVQAFTLTTLGEVLLATGEAAEGKEVLAEAIRISEEKGYTVGAEAARALLRDGGADA